MRAATSAPEGHQGAQHEQLHELEAKLEEDRRRLQQLRNTLKQECRGDGRAARLRARDVQRRINEDEGGDQPLAFNRAI